MEFHSELTRAIIGEFYYVYNRLGLGFIETRYATALERRLRIAGMEVAREYEVQVLFDGEEIGWDRLDMVVNRSVVIELKTGPTLPPHSRRQLFNYLRSTRLEVGLLLYFGPEPRFWKVFLPNVRDAIA